MSNIYIADIVGTGIYTVPADDAAMAAATAGLNTLLNGIVGLTYNRVLSWVETRGGVGATRRLSCLIETFIWSGDACPSATEIYNGTGTGLSEQIQATLEGDPNISSIGIQQYNLVVSVPNPWTDQHKVLRQLIHFIDNGPAEGFASGAYRQTTGTAFPSAIVWYDSAAPTKKKIVEKLISYSGVFPSVITWKVYDTSETLLATVTDTISYSGAFETSRVRTIV